MNNYTKYIPTKKAAFKLPLKSDCALNANHHNTKYSILRVHGQQPIVFYTPNAQPVR